MTDRDEVISTLRATLLSCRGSITFDQCNRDYKSLQGETIPYAKLGFKTLHDLFASEPGFKVSKNKDGDFKVDVIPSDLTKNIADLVSKQRITKKPTRPMGLPQRRVKPSGKPEVYNYHWRTSNVNLLKHQKTQNQIPHKNISNKKPNNTQPLDRSQLPGITRTISNNHSEPSSPPLNKPEIPTNVSKTRLDNGKGTNHNVISPNSKPKISSRAADRLAVIQKDLQQDQIKENQSFVEKRTTVNNVTNEIKKLCIDKDYKENKNRLLKLCQLMELNEPIFKVHEIRSKRGPPEYDCATKIGTESFSTYPNSLNSRELAIEKSASMALEHLQKIANEKKIPSTPPTIAIDRVIKLVANYPCGIFAKNLPEIYHEKYSESLCENWLDLIKNSPCISMDEAVNGSVILLPSDQKSILSSSSSTSSISLEDTSFPPPIQYPDDSQWNVYVTSAKSTVEIWVKLIGEQYSDALESLNTDMENYFMINNKPCSSIAKGGWYALKLDEGWFRTRVFETDIKAQTALCFLIDVGDEETHTFDKLFDLAPQFLSLPPQAILCRLSGLEEYTVADGFLEAELPKLVHRSLIAEIHKSADEIARGDDPTFSVVLYDTSTDLDVNLNSELMQELIKNAGEPQLPDKGFASIFICEVKANGVIYARIENKTWLLLQKMLEEIVNGPFPIKTLQATVGSFNPKPNTNYLVKSLSGEWLRAVLLSPVKNTPKGECVVSAKFIDCGRTENVSIKNILLLERLSSVLNALPPQVIKLTLHNVTSLNEENVKWMNKILPRDEPVLCRQFSAGSNSVEINVKIQGVFCCINNAINMENEIAKRKKDKFDSDPHRDIMKKMERIYPTPINRFNIPEKGSQFNIFVSMAANPSNFTVLSLSHQAELNNLMTGLQTALVNVPPLSSAPVIGSAYAAFHEKDGSWYRVTVQGIISNDVASIYYCDFGDLKLTDVTRLKELPLDFKKLPAQAIKAKLHGVSPINADWSVEDCLRFQEIVVDKNFVSIVEKVERDPLQKSEPLLTLNLVDTSSDDDIYINDVLIKEGRAKRNFS